MNIKHLKQIIFSVIVFLIGILIYSTVLPAVTLAAPYGQCAYGSYLYNGQCHKSDPPSSGGSSSGGGTSTGSNVCSSQSPPSAPNLYQINTTGSSATLYFAPSLHPYDNYYVAFGDNQKSEGYGAGFSLSQTTGALKYDVYKLKPNTRYTFKVRAGNGCMPGPWSSTLAVKTGYKNSKYINKYYPFRQAYVTKSIWTRINGIWTSILKIFPR
ncbi:MAG: fibronectin type III domain-containing protein [Minisyncoccia bacterium]